MIIRIDLRWNFGRLASETSMCYRDKLKTPVSYLLGANFGYKTCQTYWSLMASETVLLVILGLLSDPLQALVKRVIIVQNDN